MLDGLWLTRSGAQQGDSMSSPDPFPDLTVDGHFGLASHPDVLAVVNSTMAAAIPRLSYRSRLPSIIRLSGRWDDGPPMVVREYGSGNSARMLVCIRSYAWAQLAYQFGHELGHIVANNWGASAAVTLPSHWIEEALVEAFALSNLRHLANLWRILPPYEHWRSYAGAFDDYALKRVEDIRINSRYPDFVSNPKLWYGTERGILSLQGTITKPVWPLVPWLIDRFGQDDRAHSAISALNLWPERGGLELPAYLDAWIESCRKIGLDDRLPTNIQGLLL